MLQPLVIWIAAMQGNGVTRSNNAHIHTHLYSLYLSLKLQTGERLPYRELNDLINTGPISTRRKPVGCFTPSHHAATTFNIQDAIGGPFEKETMRAVYFSELRPLGQ